MGPRFALRWTVIGLICFVGILAVAFLLRTLSPRSAEPAQRVSLDALAAAAEMPFDKTGSGTQIISDTVLTLKLQPYPAQSSVPSTVTLAVVSPNGSAGMNAEPVLAVKNADGANAREYVMLPVAGGLYSASGNLFPTAGTWRIRVVVKVGDDVPAMMLATVSTH